MKRAAFGLALALVVGACGDGDRSSSVQEPCSGPALVTFGHSFVSGTANIGGPKTPWPTLAARELELCADNRGVSGTTSAQIQEVVESYEVSPTDTVVIEAILNDVFTDGRAGVDGYRESLDGMLRHLTRGADPDVLVLVDPPWPSPLPHDDELLDALAAYARATRTVVARYPAVALVDLGRGWRRRHVDDDGLHPSVAGTAHIARLVASRAR